MTRLVVAILAGAVAFAAMEPWARILHGRVWHGVLFGVHRSHHAHRRGRFESNDLLSGLHAPVAAMLLVIGCNTPGHSGGALLGAGVGMTCFGFAYAIVHDGLIHRRLPVAFLARVPWLRRIRDAHRVHHLHGGPPYGLFLGPRELERARSGAERSPERLRRRVSQRSQSAR